MKQAPIVAVTIALALLTMLGVALNSPLQAQDVPTQDTESPLATPEAADVQAAQQMTQPIDSANSITAAISLTGTPAITQTNATTASVSAFPTATVSADLALTESLPAALSITATATVTTGGVLTETASPDSALATTVLSDDLPTDAGNATMQPISTATPTGTPVVIIVVATPEPHTSTPTPAAAQRAVQPPTPEPTPDYALTFALILDSTVQAAGWIWFLAGSLVFFAVAGLVAGLSFRQSERRRYELMDDPFGDDPIVDEAENPHSVADDAGQDDDNWPSSLP